MTTMADQAYRDRRLRGQILYFVRRNHQLQQSRLDHVMVWDLLREYEPRIGRNTVVTLLQDLQTAGYITYTEKCNDITGDVDIERIELTADGLRLLARSKTDDLVLIL